jgi:hypothetical protein
MIESTGEDSVESFSRNEEMKDVTSPERDEFLTPEAMSPIDRIETSPGESFKSGQSGRTIDLSSSTDKDKTPLAQDSILKRSWKQVKTVAGKAKRAITFQPDSDTESEPSPTRRQSVPAVKEQSAEKPLIRWDGMESFPDSIPDIESDDVFLPARRRRSNVEPSVEFSPNPSTLPANKPDLPLSTDERLKASQKKKKKQTASDLAR